MHKERAIEVIRKNYPQDGYTQYHAVRYAMLIDLLDNYSLPDAKILDLGRSRFTNILHQRLGRDIDTLGFEKEGKYDTGYHYYFNLNDCQFPETCRKDLPHYDTIIMAEVIEHLYTSPLLVLPFLRSLLNKNGILVVQTPNAAAIHKRLKMIAGRNPYELIRTDYTNPGHFREYTANELREIGKEVGFQIVQLQFGNYFDYQYRPVNGEHPTEPQKQLAIFNTLFKAIPNPLKPGVTVVYRKN